MGILSTMQQQAQQPETQQPQQLPPSQQSLNNNSSSNSMAGMYQMLMKNSMQAISGVAEQRIKEKGVDGVADLVAMAMISNLEAAHQNGKTIPPKIMLQVAKDIALQIIQQMGVPEDELDDVLISVLLKAIQQFGEATNGILPDEEEQEYLDLLDQINASIEEHYAQQQAAQ